MSASSRARPSICCWMGEEQVAGGRKLLEDSGIPAFRMPETAIELFHHISTYYKNQKLLLQTPEPTRQHGRPEAEGAKMLIEALLAERRKVLSEMGVESHPAPSACRWPRPWSPAPPPRPCCWPNNSVFPVAMKVDSPDLLHKVRRRRRPPQHRQRPGGAQRLPRHYRNGAKRHPSARINGVSIEPFLSRPNGRELMIGVFRDPTFGPVISFGAGGFDVEIFSDRSVALPPLNKFLAQDLIRIDPRLKVLGEFHNMPRSTVRPSGGSPDLHFRNGLRAAVDHRDGPQPADRRRNGAIAADARIVIDHASSASGDRYSHMAIYPYPVHPHPGMADERRPDGHHPPDPPGRCRTGAGIRQNMSDESRATTASWTPSANSPRPCWCASPRSTRPGNGAARRPHRRRGQRHPDRRRPLVLNPDGESVEFALAVGDAWQKCGVGRKLMTALIDCARMKGYRAVVGDVLAANGKMFNLMTSLGFTIHPIPNDTAVKRVVNPLTG